MEMEIARHSLAHVLAMAVRKLMPDVQLGIGPAIEHGFYYDFLLPEGATITAETLEEIGLQMQAFLKQDLPFERVELPLAEARKRLLEAGEGLKVELLDDLERAGETRVSLYRSGDFVDLCRGPHVPSTRHLLGVAFRLDRVSGAYWRGDERRPMLQRVYGLAHSSKKELKAYLNAREEAAKRDHRKLGKELGLYVTSAEVGKGLPLLTPRGATLRRVLERFVVDEELRRGYLHVHTPDLGRKLLYEISGHWQLYQESMYPTLDLGGVELCLRPMACPHHFMLYRSEPHSYRDLPLRYAEIVKQYRREQSGELSGLIRLMCFHLADAHIFCREDQVREEFLRVVDLVKYVMRCLGLQDVISYRASLHDHQRDKYVDNPVLWESAEKLLLEIAEEAELDCTIAPGEAAFYGPKIDVQIRNVLGKEDTIFTLQIDFALPERFDLGYIDAGGRTARPVVIHRSSIGCLERTIAFLIEHYAGAFPTWLAPVQARLMTITDASLDYAKRVEEQMLRAGIRCELDGRGDTIGKKKRDGRLQRIPYLVSIGAREEQEGTITVRNRDTKKQSVISPAAFEARLLEEVAGFSLELAADG